MTFEPSDIDFPPAFGMTIAISFLVLAVSFAARAILGLGMQEWASDFGWSRSEISGVGSIALLAMPMTVPLAGYAADRWGPRFVLGIGCIALAGGLTIIAFMKEYWHFILAYGLLCGTGFGLVSLPVVGSLVVGQARNRQGLATGIATSGTTGGQLLIIPTM